ncbi:hypothetical protein J7E93_06365 [Streptomyces sp. ISL-36]|uniref:hypothetical protein n=1 Tax=Streptomyces sp. ISL-36 TaxID=2819182 RepID=UPI001BE9F19F|nr:hypothetical protein [Streptomyces sp. ISL-36]MBT2439750.1 hypothetical protein [Streptomyces sp. ISL-36]
MPEFHVTWEIDLDAANAVDAARKALAIQRDAGSWATVFTVHGEAQTVTVDLDPDHLAPSGGGVPLVVLAA